MVIPDEQDPAVRGTFVETPEAKEVWRRVRKLVRAAKLLEGDTLDLKGVVTKVELGPGNRYFREERKQKDGTLKPWFFVKVHATLTDPQAIGEDKPLALQPKKVGASFFNGMNRDGSRSPFRGGMYDLHRATFHAEPSQALIDGKEAWDTDDYSGVPLILRFTYNGMEEEGSQYFGTKANMKIFLQTFDRDKTAEVTRPTDPRLGGDDEEDDEDREPVAAGKGKRQAKPVDEDDSDEF
jgi:hypothetical protein